MSVTTTPYDNVTLYALATSATSAQTKGGIVVQQPDGTPKTPVSLALLRFEAKNGQIKEGLTLDNILHSKKSQSYGFRYIPTVKAIAVTGTLASADMMGGIVNCTTTAAITLTLPTAALLVAELKANSICNTPLAVGQAFSVHFSNIGANTLTIAPGTGGTYGGSGSNKACATLTSSTCIFVITNITAASEAYIFY